MQLSSLNWNPPQGNYFKANYGLKGARYMRCVEFTSPGFRVEFPRCRKECPSNVFMWPQDSLIADIQAFQEFPKLIHGTFLRSNFGEALDKVLSAVSGISEAATYIKSPSSRQRKMSP
ncbi:hypothetical protein AFLA_012713 [Aspergillus flavus NRRL3357]|nr:hypothetical protein AFLA_012713 [Aspergillus flavus NRRL3357]